MPSDKLMKKLERYNRKIEKYQGKKEKVNLSETYCSSNCPIGWGCGEGPMPNTKCHSGWCGAGGVCAYQPY